MTLPRSDENEFWDRIRVCLISHVNLRVLRQSPKPHNLYYQTQRIDRSQCSSALKFQVSGLIQLSG